jgi:hypothetical protein
MREVSNIIGDPWALGRTMNTLRLLFVFILLLAGGCAHEGLMRVTGSYPHTAPIKRCLQYWTSNFSTNATNHFYIGAAPLSDGTTVALAYWKEERTILEFSELAADAPKGAEIEAWIQDLRLDRDTVDTLEDVGGSNYLVTHRTWVDWMEQCLSRGRECVVLFEEARRFYPAEKIPDDI